MKLFFSFSFKIFSQSYVFMVLSFHPAALKFVAPLSLDRNKRYA